MSIIRAGVAEVGEFSVVSAVSSCVLSLSEGISVFPGLGVHLRAQIRTQEVYMKKIISGIRYFFRYS